MPIKNPRAETIEELITSGTQMPIMEHREAADQGLKFYWTGRACIRGHNSKRWVSSKQCAACQRIRLKETSKNFNAITAKQIREEKLRQRAVIALPVKDRQKILEAYAETGDLTRAAAAARMTLAELNVQLAKNAHFAVEIAGLEKRLNVVKQKKEETYSPSRLVWTDAVRKMFITAYVDTGDMAAAREAVGASPSNYFDELEQNEEFAKAVKEAEPKALKVLEEKAIQLATKGNDKLITLVLKAKNPDYKDKIQIEQKTQVTISDERLNERIAHLLGKYGQVVDGTVVARSITNEPPGQGSVAGLLGRIEQTAGSQ